MEKKSPNVAHNGLADEIIHELPVAAYQNTFNTNESFIEKRIDGVFVRQKCIGPGRYIIF
jgi:hypothetical protein